MRAILLLALLALAPLAVATHNDPCEIRTAALAIEIDTALAGSFYVVPGFLDPFGEDDLFVYEETNGVEGLQRYDVWRDGVCGHPELADTVVL